MRACMVRSTSRMRRARATTAAANDGGSSGKPLAAGVGDEARSSAEEVAETSTWAAVTRLGAKDAGASTGSGTMGGSLDALSLVGKGEPVGVSSARGR
jgi:hypothetical protein